MQTIIFFSSGDVRNSNINTLVLAEGFVSPQQNVASHSG
jgi:hypothetical protein